MDLCEAIAVSPGTGRLAQVLPVAGRIDGKSDAKSHGAALDDLLVRGRAYFSRDEALAALLMPRDRKQPQ